MNKRIIACMKRGCSLLLILLMGGLCACKDYADYDAGNVNTVYVDKEFNNEESQLYMRGRIAATESGYYYISQAPVHMSGEALMYINFFDIGTGATTILCSKANCEHNDENCDAYINSSECLGYNIWYYNERIYMMERTDERDILVSYDKNLRDKKNHMELSVDGNSVNPSSANTERAVICGDELFYIVGQEKGQSVYSVSLKEEGSSKIIKQYNNEHEAAELLSLHPNKGKLYMNLVGINKDSRDYICDVYDLSSREVMNQYNSKDNVLSVRGDIEDWNGGVCFIDNNIFFGTVTEQKFIVNKLNLNTKICEEIYEINAEDHNNSAKKYMEIRATDGARIYVLEGRDPLKAKKGEVNGNNVHIIDTSGKLIDTLKIEDAEKHNASVTFDIFCVDKRYIFVNSGLDKIKGLQLSESQQKKYDEIDAQAVVTHKNAGISVSGLIDVKEIGTGKYSWINATSK